jgi:hypothetical protein
MLSILDTEVAGAQAGRASTHSIINIQMMRAGFESLLIIVS